MITITTLKNQLRWVRPTPQVFMREGRTKQKLKKGRRGSQKKTKRVGGQGVQGSIWVQPFPSRMGGHRYKT